MTRDPLGAKATLNTALGTVSYVSFAQLAATTGAEVARMPHTVKILLENIARRVGSRDVSEADVVALAPGQTAPMLLLHLCQHGS